jgi:HEPN domain-containing protein
MSNHSRNRGNVVTRVATGMDPTTDEGRAKGFRQGACECLQGAQALSSCFPNSAGEYILTAQALELALKSLLAKSGLSDKALERKPFRHDLEKLCEKAQKLGLSISAASQSNIQWLNQYHSAPLRYDFIEKRELPPCKVYFPIVEEILAYCTLSGGA